MDIICLQFYITKNVYSKNTKIKKSRMKFVGSEKIELSNNYIKNIQFKYLIPL